MLLTQLSRENVQMSKHLLSEFGPMMDLQPTRIFKILDLNASFALTQDFIHPMSRNSSGWSSSALCLPVLCDTHSIVHRVFFMEL